MKTLENKIESLIKDYENEKLNCEKDFEVTAFKDTRLIYETRITQISQIISDLKNLIKESI